MASLFQGSITDVENQWTDLLYPNTTANFTAEDFESFKDFVNNTITNYTDIWPVVYTETSNNITELLETLAKGYNTTNFLYNGTDVDSSTNVPAGWLDFVDAFYNLFEVVVSSFFTTFGFEAPDEAIGGNPSADKLLTADFNLVLLVVSTSLLISSFLTRQQTILYLPTVLTAPSIVRILLRRSRNHTLPDGLSQCAQHAPLLSRSDHSSFFLLYRRHGSCFTRYHRYQ